MNVADAHTNTSRLFPSLVELRAVHRHLLDEHHTNGSTSELRLALQNFVARARETGRILHDEEQRDSAQAVIDYWVAALYRERVEIARTTLETFDPAAAPTLPEESCPYVGLQPFDETKKDLFFGRARVLEGLVALLQTRRLVCVIGQSGTGKSSLVAGGLVPALRRDAVPGSRRWRFLGSVVPGSEPLKSLLRLLKPADFVASDEWTREELRKLTASPSYLHERLTEREPEPVFLVVDQFEELFTLCGDETARQAFAAALSALVTAADARHTVVITVRSDYETHLVQLSDLEALVRAGEIRVGALNASELREAIEAPARMVGLQFDHGLADAMIDDTLGEPAALPLLQYALRRLWDKRDRNRLTFEEYNALGGALNALATRANTVYHDFAEEHRVTAKRFFLRLIRPGQGLENMSRRLSKAELFAGEVRTRAEFVLEQFVAERLLRVTAGVTDDDTYIEIAHEALARNWQLLMQWLDQQRVHIITRDRLQAAAQEWVERGRAAGLLDEAQTADAERWLQSPEAAELGTTALLWEFVKASRAQADEAAATSVVVRKRWLRLVGALVAAVVAVLTIGLFYVDASRARADARRMAAVAMRATGLAETKAAEARSSAAAYERGYRDFFNSSEHDKIAALREKVLKPLEAERDALRRQIQLLADEKTQLESRLSAQDSAASTTRNDLVTQVGDLTAKLTKARLDLEQVNQRLEIESRNHAATAEQLKEARARLDAVQPPPRISPLPKGQKLRVGQPLGNNALCCFFKVIGSRARFFVTSASAAPEVGELVTVRLDNGVTHKIGVVWKFVAARQGGAAIVLMLPDVDRHLEYPGVGDVWKLDDDIGTGDDVKVIMETGAVTGKVVQQDKDNFVIVGMSAAVRPGSAVLDDDDDLVGVVTAVEPNQLHAVMIGPVKRAVGLDFDF